MSEALQKQRRQAVTIALVATTVLSLAKIVVASLTGSVGVLSEGIHSVLDLISSIVTRVVVERAHRPADEDRPFGHGKLENLSALLEAVLLVVAGLYMIYESVGALHHGRPLDHLDWAAAVTLVSIVVNIVVYIQNRHVGQAVESIAIETNAYHFLTDALSSVGLLAGLVVIHLTGWVWVDAVAGFAIAAYVFWVSFQQIQKCIEELSDVALPEDEMTEIRKILSRFEGQIIDFHDLKTRKAGATRYIDMHLSICAAFTVKDAHDVCDAMEAALMERFPGAHVSIHPEPCDYHGKENGSDESTTGGLAPSGGEDWRCREVCSFPRKTDLKKQMRS